MPLSYWVSPFRHIRQGSKLGNHIIVVTSFPPTPGGYTSYTKTFIEYCNKRGVKCTWLLPTRIPLVGPVLAGVRSQSFLAQAELGSRTTRKLHRNPISWLAEIILWLILLQLYKKPRQARVVCMDALSSIALRPDLLIVHGPYADEVGRRSAWRALAYAVSRKLELTGYKRAQRLVSVDAYLQNRVQELAGVDSILIPNPISLEQFTIRNKVEAKTALKFDSSKPLVLFVGFTPEKYAERIPFWREQLESLGFATVHVSRGDIEYDEMPVYYNAADIVVSLSTFPAYQRAVIESLACGTPAVSNNSPLAYYASPERLVETIKSFRCDQSREQLRDSVLKFDKNLVCNQILALLEEQKDATDQINTETCSGEELDH